ncbi:hypothetical protein PMKS-002167 [Pichia membranifaciens]|uniref:Chromatin modification-related protein EAF6 n=1 Tax=Pichia membranifaciens TaxID=4926 RepID=A0A1Q2YH29_9ASCO|nr:hypothetical protein PMKS-002167 [Pichia membranifaciens]
MSATPNSTSTPSPSKVGKPSAAGSSAKYKQLVKQLKQNIAKQEKLEDEIDTIEHAIYNKESVYLASTASIIKGFDSYMSSDHNYSSLNNGTADSSTASDAASAAAITAAAAANISVLDNNRIFSLSSATFVKQINDMNKEINKAREKEEATAK